MLPALSIKRMSHRVGCDFSKQPTRESCTKRQPDLPLVGSVFGMNNSLAVNFTLACASS